MTKMEPKYEVYVRLPFNRGDFVDPPPVEWNESKSDALWNIIYEVERSEGKVDWNELATSFNVGVDFLLMMAQTLAERHTNQLMGLFRKAATLKTGSGAPSPVTGAFPDTTPVNPSSESMKRTASGSGGARPSSPASIRRASPLPATANPGSGSGSIPLKASLAAVRPPVSTRPSSTNTTVLTQNLATAMSQPVSAAPSKSTTPRPKSPILPRSGSHRPSNLHLSTTGIAPSHHPASPSSSPAQSSSPSSSSTSSSPVQSRIIRRPPRPAPKPSTTTSLFPDALSDDDAEPAFLPHNPDKTPAGTVSSSSNTQDLGATLRGAPHRRPGSKAAATAFLSSPSASTASERQAGDMQASDSSGSSAARLPGARAAEAKRAGRGGGGGPLSPRRTVELKRREGSDGAPSMGSSFSDLDASVTQSALEEALASKMQDGAGTIGSRMSTFGNAIRSRYLPAKGSQQ